MKALWQALSLLASDDVFRTEVKAASDVEIREDQPTEPVDLQPQPTFQALQEIDRLFRDKELYLSAYELGEINRWVRYRSGVEQVAEMWKILKKAAAAAGGNLDNPSPDFMAAIGAMAIDSKFRSRAWYEEATQPNRAQLPNGETILENRGFLNLSNTEKAVLTELGPGGKADNLCKEFFLAIWSGYPCTSLATVYPGWVHSNA